MRYWGSGGGVDFGLGYTAYVFARSDVNHYLPAAVPIGKADSGNIALVFGRWSWK